MDAKMFGAFLAQVRRAQGLTQAELAEQLHVTDKAVSRWERGVGLPGHQYAGTSGRRTGPVSCGPDALP